MNVCVCRTQGIDNFFIPNLSLYMKVSCGGVGGIGVIVFEPNRSKGEGGGEFDYLFISHSAFSAGYVIDGLLREKMFEMVGYAVTILVIMTFVVFNYAAKSKEWKDKFRLVREWYLYSQMDVLNPL